jgi:DNA modification methylase
MWKILEGDARTQLATLDAESVHCCITSPPYYGLRAYLDKDDPNKRAEIGAEETPDLYIEHLVQVFREVRRVLHKTGTVWLNLGDSYATHASKRSGQFGKPIKEGFDDVFRRKKPKPESIGYKEKDQLFIPHRVAMALQADGWYCRSTIIWAKPNCMPESVTDRPTTAHEYVFLLTKNERYFYDADAIREPHQEDSKRRAMRGNTDKNKYAAGNHLPEGVHPMTMSQPRDYQGYERMEEAILNGETPLSPAGRNKRTVWTVSTKPLALAHFATFPPDLIEPMILAGTSQHGCCATCLAPYTRVVEREPMQIRNGPKAGGYGSRTTDALSGTMIAPAESRTVGWRASCTCGASIVPCTILDPFAGAGTTIMESLRHGRDAIGVELNSGYAQMARDRIVNDAPMFNAM